MNYAIRLSRFSLQSPNFPSSSSGFASNISSATRSGGVRLLQIKSNSNNDPDQQSFQNMDKSNKSSGQQDKNLNVMEEAFGEGYSTRSDEEGFGGVYGGNDEENVEMKIIKDPARHDSTQGSEVKEKEKARNQAKVG